MNYEVYSIRDRVTGMYGGLVLHVNKASAQRWFSDVCAKDEHAFDYDLYFIGEFDTQTGVFNSDMPAFVCNVNSLKDGDEV